MLIEWTQSVDDVRRMMARAEEMLCRDEARNNVLFSVFGGKRGVDFAVAAVDEAGEVHSVAGRNVDRPLVISVCESAAVRTAMYEALLTRPGWMEVTADKQTAWELASLRAAQQGGVVRQKTSLGVYACRAVTPPVGVAGTLRQARDTDAALLAQWWVEFAAEINEPTTPESAVEYASAAIAEGRPHIWETDSGVPVSVAAWAGPTPNGIRVNFVYTPLQHRGLGYASANVAALTTKLLAGGRKVVFLFTDLDNPVSNKIYRRIGYGQVGENAHVVVERH
jgi:predicted GNAT family acetyltransferase